MENNIEQPNLNKSTNQRIIILIIFVTAITAGLLFLVTNLSQNQEKTTNLNENSNQTVSDEASDPNLGEIDVVESPEIIVNDNTFEKEVDLIVEDIENLDTELGNDTDISDEILGL